MKKTFYPSAAFTLTSRLKSFLPLLLAGLFSFSRADAQQPPGRQEVFAGSELEMYLRNLQLIGSAPVSPWSLRGFSASQVDQSVGATKKHVWQQRFDLDERPRGRVESGLIRPTVGAQLNSGFPFGSNDGPVWAGRGLTTQAQAGFFVNAGPLSITVAPMFFRAENAAFPLFGGMKCPPDCFDARFGGEVDKPQRFGDAAYSRIDPGQSTVRIDAVGAAAGFTTANEWWGPTEEYPFLLGNNAAGFPHFFLGTASPRNVLIGHLTARLIYGRLDQSEYSSVKGSKYYTSADEPGRVRFASGLLLSLQPNGFDGLEIGGGRFIHTIWPSTGIPRSYLRKPFEGFLKHDIRPIPGFPDTQGGADNQLVSVFARWVFPGSGVEVYSEYGREDHSYDRRDLLQEIDHSRAYSLGFRKAFVAKDSSFRILRAEIFNSELPGIVRTGRGEGGVYIHQLLRQGHTERGQLLGADVGTGSGAASTVAYDRYDSRGRRTLFWERKIRQQRGDFYETGVVDPRATDVMHTIGVERLRFGRIADNTVRFAIVRDFNRDFERDVWNLNLGVSLALRALH